MSRIGNRLIQLPEGVTLTVNGNVATVTGPKGTLNVTLNHGISVEIEGNVVKVVRANDTKQIKQTNKSNLNFTVKCPALSFNKFPISFSLI